jgi:hypothetical protein
MSFILSSGNVQSPLNNGGVAYGTGSGVKVSAAGTAGQVLLSTGTGAPTWGAASAAGSITAIASGTLPTGQAVIVNADGTVSVVTKTPGSTITVGSATVFDASNTASAPYSSTYDAAHNKVIIIFEDVANSYYGQAIVGNISGSTITFGSAVIFDSTAANYFQCCTYDSTNQKIVIAYQPNASGVGYAIVGTVSGTAISFGTRVNFSGAIGGAALSICYNSDQNSVLIAFYNSLGSYFPWCVAGQVSGTSISFGTAVQITNTYTIENANRGEMTCCYDSTNKKVAIFYTLDNGGGGARLYGIVATLTGTAISLGTATILNSNGGQYISCAYDSVSGTSVVFFNLIGYNYLSAIVSTISGTGISGGTRVDITTTATTWTSAVAEGSLGKVIVFFTQASQFASAAGTVSGTTISFGSILTVNSFSGSQYPVTVTFDPISQKIVYAYFDTTNSSYGTVKLGNNFSTNVTTSNFVGFSSGSYTNGQTATINTIGATDSNQTSLTPGSAYYVTNSGTLSTTADSPSVYAGLAIASTKILVKG